MRTRTIHHFEDQPEHLRWLAGNLFNRYCLEKPELVKSDEIEESRTPAFRAFVLSINGNEWRVEHRLYTTAEEFTEGVRRASDGDLALVDIMKEDRRGHGIETPGLDLYQTAKQKLGENHVFVVTAIPDMARSINVPNDYIFRKPADFSDLVTFIMERLEFN